MKNLNSFILMLMILPLALVAGGELSAQENEFLTGSGKKKADSSKEALETIQGYLGALREHNIAKSYYAFTSSKFRNSTPWEAYRGFIFENPALLQNSSAEFGEPNYQETMIIFRGTLTTIDKEKKTAEFALVPENNQWKLLGIKIYPAPTPKQER